MSKRKKTIHVGTISARDLLNAPAGHLAHITGTGAHRNRRADAKLRRRRDKAACRDSA